jgi:hypothetical protein
MKPLIADPDPDQRDTSQEKKNKKDKSTNIEKLDFIF